MSATAYANAIFFEEIYSATFDQSFPKQWVQFEMAHAYLCAQFDNIFGDLGFKVPPTAEEKLVAVDCLLNSKAFDQEGDQYTGVWVKFLPKRKDEFINEWVAASPEAQRLRKLGEDARVNAILRSAKELGWALEDSEKLASGAFTTSVSSDPLQIPASDRIVSRNDNQDEYEQIENVIEEIRDLVRTDNEIGSALADGRELISSELEIANEVTKRGKFRVSSLLGWLSPALRFLADKFAGGAIGEAAKRLLDLLIGLL